MPPGCETVDCLPSYNLIPNFYLAISMLQRPVEESLGNLPGPDCIISDKYIPWTADTCAKWEIPRIIFDGMSCFAELIIHRLYDYLKVDDMNSVGQGQVFAVPGFPEGSSSVKGSCRGCSIPDLLTSVVSGHGSERQRSRCTAWW